MRTKQVKQRTRTMITQSLHSNAPKPAANHASRSHQRPKVPSIGTLNDGSRRAGGVAVLLCVGQKEQTGAGRPTLRLRMFASGVRSTSPQECQVTHRVRRKLSTIRRSQRRTQGIRKVKSHGEKVTWSEITTHSQPVQDSSRALAQPWEPLRQSRQTEPSTPGCRWSERRRRAAHQLQRGTEVPRCSRGARRLCQAAPRALNLAELERL